MNFAWSSPVFASELAPETPLSNLPASAPVAFEQVLEAGSAPAGERALMSDTGVELIDGVAPGQIELERLRPDTSQPRDVAEATYGPPPPAPAAIVLPDDRRRISRPADYPWRMNASLVILAPDNQLFVGTGWFIGPRTLVTAGHCVFIHDQQGRYRDWAREIRVMPGRDGTSLPYGVTVSNTFHSVAGWARDRNPRYDYAVIEIPVDLGTQTNWYGFGVYEDAALVGRTANISGYPSDKVGPEDGTQWYDAREIVGVDSHQVHYQVDTCAGQSGSAVWLGEDGERYAVGVHAYGTGLGNSATRITPSVRENLLRWRK
jgi:V8-like Glu-specific endopeptidase